MSKGKNPKLLRTIMTVMVGAALWTTYGYVQPSQVEASGHEVCKECHEEVVTAFAQSYHGKAWIGMGKAAGCQACHGSPDQHKDNPSNETIITFGKSSKQSAQEQSARSLACHQKSANLMFWDMGAHQKNDVACSACHDIHQGRSIVSQPDVCFTCHRDVRTAANKMSHHPIVEGKVLCSDCHNTHGTLTKHMLNAETTNQLCYKCHADKRGPWIWEHPPVEEDCAICHTPHGSRHESLMVEKIVNLCQDCHDDRQHHDNLNDGRAGADHYVLKRGCIECHHAVHGSANLRRSLTR